MRKMMRSASLYFGPRDDFYPTHGLTYRKECLEVRACDMYMSMCMRHVHATCDMYMHMHICMF